MRILSRYILREVLWHALIGTGIFTFVLFMGRVGQILELVVRNSAPLPSVAQLIFLALPAALTVTIPMGVLVGILIGLSRLAADSEVTAMRASGFGLEIFLVPVGLLAIVAWLLAMGNTVFLAPRSAAALASLQEKLKSSQASFEVEPRVFFEDFKDKVLYVGDVIPENGVAVWQKIFLADVSDPSAPTITMAQQGVATSQSTDSLALRLSDGYVYETPAKQPDQNFTRGFRDLELSIPVTNHEATPKELAPVPQMTSSELYRQMKQLSHRPGFDAASGTMDAARWRWYATEFNRRLALPAACLVLALLGIPLGLSAKRGGKATGFVLTIVLVFIYYFLSLGGVSLGRLDKISPALGVWLGNIVFFLAGAALLWRSFARPIDVNLEPLWQGITAVLRRSRQVGEETRMRLMARRRFAAGFPQILDDYVIREFVLYLLLVLVTFLILALVFEFFELLSDIVRNRVPLLTVMEYLGSVVPGWIYLLAPLAILVAVLITFGQMEKYNEITAMKASGISVYRSVTPVLALASLIALGLFFFNEYYLPSVNRQQEVLRNAIKGKPAQTFLRPDRMWIFGRQNSVFYYEFFDADRNSFGNISVFEFDPSTWSLSKRIYAERAHWEPGLDRFVFERGWARSFNGAAIQDFHMFDVSTFAEIEETPAYFKREIKQYTEMDSAELSHYIADMEQSGFEVVRLKVQLYKKFAYPLIALVMAILATPFSLRAARRGALAGVAVAVGIGITFFLASNLFEKLGDLNQLPPGLAAWAPDLIFGFGGGYLILKVST